MTIKSRLRQVFRRAAIQATPFAVLGAVFGYGYPIGPLATRVDYLIQGVGTGLFSWMLVSAILAALGALAEFVFKI
jgi:hypothetical protein